MILKNVLVTGGAGFIGSNLVEALLQDKRVGLVRVLDDLSNGSLNNLTEFLHHPRFEFLKGDICHYDTCLQAMEGIHLVSHQAALGSVPRSIENPMRTTEVNILGTVNVLFAAHLKGAERVVLACSSSTYGDSAELPKVEERIGNPLSPYAVTKAAIEDYAQVFARAYGLQWIGLRYFNVFGPKQTPDNPYAAVIPIFCKAFLEGGSITINGDGGTSRDFTYVDNAVQANVLSLFTPSQEAVNQVYNIACGEQTTLNELTDAMKTITGKSIDILHGPERAGDVRHSKASINKASRLLGYVPSVFFKEGIERVMRWYGEERREE